jgi:hypothetical protein
MHIQTFNVLLNVLNLFPFLIKDSEEKAIEKLIRAEETSDLASENEGDSRRRTATQRFSPSKFLSHLNKMSPEDDEEDLRLPPPLPKPADVLVNVSIHRHPNKQDIFH